MGNQNEGKETSAATERMRFCSVEGFGSGDLPRLAILNAGCLGFRPREMTSYARIFYLYQKSPAGDGCPPTITMLKYLKLENVGPAEQMELELGSRLNILTGDNGLGKSFLLDVAWFVNTRSWPADVNPKITNGLVLFPGAKDPKIEAGFSRNDADYAEVFHEFRGRFMTFDGQIDHSQLVVYLMADGSCCVFDPYRNVPRDQVEMERLPRAFVFNQSEILYGLYANENNRDSLCEGLIRDWASWQREDSGAFLVLKKVLEMLSPDPGDPIKPGKLTRISILDSKDMPTIEWGGQGTVAIVHASSSIKRIVGLAYILVWAWQEHLSAAKLRRETPTSDLLFLVDEVDAHLHPSWQRRIVPAFLEALVHGMVMDGIRDHIKGDNATLETAKDLKPQMSLQIIATTHSPLIMASVEPEFNSETDAWFDLDLVGENGHRKVELTKREFEVRGDANRWLMSQAFDLHSSRSEQAERALDRAGKALEREDVAATEVNQIHEDLLKYLPAGDVFLVKWDMLGRKKGWWA